MEKMKTIVAAFDFDGTVSYFDTLVPFLWSTAGTMKTAKNLACLIPPFIRFINNRDLRQETKEQLLKEFLSGKEYGDLAACGTNYAKGLLNRFIKPEALERIAWHKKQNHTLVLISANLKLYLEPWGKMNSFDHILSSELEFDHKGQATGKLKGKNCWGQEKVIRLTELLGSKENYILYAYGNSRGDQELLNLADYSFYRTFQ